jgi:hypothetical protein
VLSLPSQYTYTYPEQKSPLSATVTRTFKTVGKKWEETGTESRKAIIKLRREEEEAQTSEGS